VTSKTLAGASLLPSTLGHLDLASKLSLWHELPHGALSHQHISSRENWVVGATHEQRVVWLAFHEFRSNNGTF
jgi:hypothetical protein